MTFTILRCAGTTKASGIDYQGHTGQVDAFTNNRLFPLQQNASMIGSPPRKNSPINPHLQASIQRVISQSSPLPQQAEERSPSSTRISPVATTPGVLLTMQQGICLTDEQIDSLYPISEKDTLDTESLALNLMTKFDEVSDPQKKEFPTSSRQNGCKADLHPNTTPDFFSRPFSVRLLPFELHKKTTALDTLPKRPTKGLTMEGKLPPLIVMRAANSSSPITDSQEAFILGKLTKRELSPSTSDTSSSRELSVRAPGNSDNPTVTTTIDLREISDFMVQQLALDNQVPRGTNGAQKELLKITGRVERTGSEIILSRNQTNVPMITEASARALIEELAVKVQELVHQGQSVTLLTNQNTNDLIQRLNIDLSGVSERATRTTLGGESAKLLLKSDQTSSLPPQEQQQAAPLLCSYGLRVPNTEEGENEGLIRPEFVISASPTVDQAELINEMNDRSLLELCKRGYTSLIEKHLTPYRVSRIEMIDLLRALPNSKISYVHNERVKHLLNEQIPYLRGEQLAHLPEERLKQIDTLQLLRLPTEARNNLSEELNVKILAFTLYQVALGVLAIFKVALGAFSSDSARNWVSKSFADSCKEQEEEGHRQLDLTKDVFDSFWKKIPLDEITSKRSTKPATIISLNT